MNELAPIRYEQVSEKPPGFAMPTGPAPPEGQYPFDQRRLLDSILRKKWMLAACFLIVTIPAGIATYLEKPLYRSSALLQINASSVRAVPYEDVLDASWRNTNLESMMRTEEELLNSQTLNSRVARRLQEQEQEQEGLETRAEASTLSKRFSVERVENSQLFRISYLAPSPNTAALVVNLYAEEFIKHHFEVRQNTRQQVKQQLERELASLEERVQLSETQLVDYARRNNITNLDEDATDLVKQRQELLEQEVAKAEVDFAAAKARRDLAMAEAEGIRAAQWTPLIERLQTKRFELQDELTRLRSQFGENWPDVVRGRSEIELVDKQLKQAYEGAASFTARESQIEFLAAERRYKTVREAAEEQRVLVDRYNSASVQYNILRREVRTNENLYESLLERLKVTNVMTGLEFGNIEVVEAGTQTLMPETPSVLWNMSLASLLGLGIGLGFVLTSDLLRTSVETRTDLEETTRLPLLGTVPRTLELSSSGPLVIGPGRASISTTTPSASALTLDANPEETGALPGPPDLVESMRSICASILLSRSEKPPGVILITSASAKNGKTTLTRQLGVALAETGASTLLVEADLRMPALAQSFDIKDDDGLSLYLAGHVAPWPKIHETSVPRLSLVAAGPPSPNPLGLLNSEPMTRFLAYAATRYRFVLIDSPPILAVADARVLSVRTDGVVLVVRSQRTSRNEIQQAERTLLSDGAKVLGIVLNDARRTRAESNYGNYRYYGRKTA